MIKHGIAPFLECSTRGDRRFSAFCAIVRGVSIEDRYQAAKVFADGTTGLNWRQAKGKKAINREETHKLYVSLWKEYIGNHPELLVVLKQASGLSDMFGQPGSICQATVLWDIRNGAV
jgi:hypothetical protein